MVVVSKKGAQHSEHVDALSSFGAPHTSHFLKLDDGDFGAIEVAGLTGKALFLLLSDSRGELPVVATLGNGARHSEQDVASCSDFAPQISHTIGDDAEDFFSETGAKDIPVGPSVFVVLGSFTMFPILLGLLVGNGLRTGKRSSKHCEQDLSAPSLDAEHEWHIQASA